MAARKKKSSKKKSAKKSLDARLKAVIAKESKRVGRPQVLTQAREAQAELARLRAIKPKAFAKQAMKQLENKIPLPILERRLAKLSQVVSNRRAWISRFGGK
jgi:hypothetical protein